MAKAYVENNEEILEYQKQLIEGVQGVLSSEKWLEYLIVQSKFRRFSFNNTIMIMLQNPNATKIMGMKKWNELNRYVMEGEQPIKIFAPKFKYYNKENKGKKKAKISKFTKGDLLNVKGEIVKQEFKGKNGYGIYLMEIDQLNYDDITGYIKVVSASEALEIGSIYRIDGVIDTYKNLKQLAITDIEFIGKVNKKSKGQVLIGFQLVDIYDISQTMGEDLPDICEDIAGDSEQAKLILDIVPELVDIPIIEEDLDYNGYFIPEQNIGIKKSLSLNHKAKTVIHEYSHYVLYKLKAGGLDLTKYIINAKATNDLYAVEEIVVESIAFMVCKYFGIDTSNYSFEYVASWSSGNVSRVKKVGGLIQKYFSKIIDKMEAAKCEMLGIENIELQNEAM